MIFKRWLGTFVSICALALAAAGQVHAAYPDRPLRLIVPYGPGATTDTSARLIARFLEARLKQAIVVENKPGAAAILGTSEALRAAPDGYTLVLLASGHAPNVFNYKLPYDPIKDVQPLSLVLNSPLVLVLNPQVPAKNMRELLAYAKANPGKLNFATTGGGEPLFLFEMIKRDSGELNMVHIPYKGGNDALTAVVRGDAHMQFTNTFQAKSFEQDGRLRILAVTFPQRAKHLPNVPTLVESGFPQAIGNNFAGLALPRGTPREIVDRLSQEIGAIVKDPEFVAAADKLGFEAVGSSPQAFQQVLQAQIDTWAPIAKALGIKPD